MSEPGNPLPPPSQSGALPSPVPPGPSAPPTASSGSYTMATPGTFEGWLTVTQTTVPVFAVGDVIYLRNLDGRLVVQGWAPKKETPPVLLDAPNGVWTWQQEQITYTVRKLPGWAIVLGVVGILVWPLLLFWFVRTNFEETGRGVHVTLDDGRGFMARYNNTR